MWKNLLSKSSTGTPYSRATSYNSYLHNTSYNGSIPNHYTAFIPNNYNKPFPKLKLNAKSQIIF